MIRGLLGQVILYAASPLAEDVQHETLYPTLRHPCVALSQVGQRDITAFRPTHSGDVKDADGRMRGFILRRRKRENRIDAENTAGKDRLGSYDTSFFHIAPVHFVFSGVLNFLHTNAH